MSTKTADTAPARAPTDPEIAAMSGCVRHLKSLDAEARVRVIDWLNQRFLPPAQHEAGKDGEPS